VEPILNTPVSAGQGEKRLGIGLFGREAGDVVTDLDLGGDDLVTTDEQSMALDAAELTQVRPGLPPGARTRVPELPT
jgi:hypothetical protein